MRMATFLNVFFLTTCGVVRNIMDLAALVYHLSVCVRCLRKCVGPYAYAASCARLRITNPSLLIIRVMMAPLENYSIQFQIESIQCLGDKVKNVHVLQTQTPPSTTLTNPE
jgi:hypothetical protein